MTAIDCTRLWVVCDLYDNGLSTSDVIAERLGITVEAADAALAAEAQSGTVRQLGRVWYLTARGEAAVGVSRV